MGGFAPFNWFVAKTATCSVRMATCSLKSLISSGFSVRVATDPESIVISNLACIIDASNVDTSLEALSCFAIDLGIPAKKLMQ